MTLYSVRLVQCFDGTAVVRDRMLSVEKKINIGAWNFLVSSCQPHWTPPNGQVGFDMQEQKYVGPMIDAGALLVRQ